MKITVISHITNRILHTFCPIDSPVYPVQFIPNFRIYMQNIHIYKIYTYIYMFVIYWSSLGRCH